VIFIKNDSLYGFNISKDLKVEGMRPKQRHSIWTRPQHRRRSQQAGMLLDQSVMWLRKATDWWC